MLAMAAAVFSVLLIITGVVKVARPHDVQKALVDLGFPRLPGVGLAIGVAEVIVGIAALAAPPVLAIQGLLYALFAVWVLVALRSSAPIASCGCLGRDDTPPTGSHVFLNVTASLLSFGAFLGTPFVLGVGFEMVAKLLVIGTGVFLSFIILTDAAHLEGVRT